MSYFDYGEEILDKGFDVEQFLEESRRRETRRLEEELGRIEEQLEKRDVIHVEAVEELESVKSMYVDRLEMLYKRFRGEEGEREEVRRKLEEVYRELREENRSHWRDRQELEKDRRELIRELSELDESLQELFSF